MVILEATARFVILLVLYLGVSLLSSARLANDKLVTV